MARLLAGAHLRARLHFTGISKISPARSLFRPGETRDIPSSLTQKTTMNFRGLHETASTSILRAIFFAIIFTSVTMASSLTISLTDWKVLSSDRGYVFSRVHFHSSCSTLKIFFCCCCLMEKHFLRPKGVKGGGGGWVTRTLGHPIPLPRAPVLMQLVT